MSVSPSHSNKIHRRTRTGCLTCRKRHVKCDEARPVCARCARGKRTCVFDSPAPDPEPRVEGSTPSVDQTVVGNVLSDPFHHRTPSASTISSRPAHVFARFRGLGPAHRRSTVGASLYATPEGRAASLDPSGCATSPGSSSFFDDLVKTERPLSDPHMFRLLRFYVDTVAPWLDLTDSQEHFARTVPQEALNFPPLLAAILAFSAQQLRKEEEEYQRIAELCYSKCVAGLIPVLESEDTAADGRVLAATVILRMYEMHHHSVDPQQHLSGSWSLLQIPRNNAFDSLRVAAFWVYLRQDIQMAERYTRPTIIDLDHCQFQCTFDTYPTYEEAWANRMVWAFGHVLNFCFGPESRRTRERWEFLDKKIAQWREHVPPSYEPIFWGPSYTGSVFPAIWFLSGWHVLGVQTYHMAKLYLTLYAPETRSEGLERLEEQRVREESLKHHARVICGICTTNSYQSARIHACEHIRTCCRVIVRPEEHAEIRELLQQVEDETGWPVTRLVSDL